jgi:hypothetical protein
MLNDRRGQAAHPIWRNRPGRDWTGVEILGAHKNRKLTLCKVGRVEPPIMHALTAVQTFFKKALMSA